MRFELAISGDIDHKSSFFDEPVPTDPGAELWIDLQDVGLVNSSGIMRWMKWCKALPATLKVFLVNCPWNVVVQSSLIEGFFPENLRIQSIRVYFFCDRDSEEKPVILHRGQDFAYAEDSSQHKSEIRVPKVPCPKCGELMTPEFAESRLFAFLKT